VFRKDPDKLSAHDWAAGASAVKRGMSLVAVNLFCPAQIWQLRNSASNYVPPPQ